MHSSSRYADDDGEIKSNDGRYDDRVAWICMESVWKMVAFKDEYRFRLSHESSGSEFPGADSLVENCFARRLLQEWQKSTPTSCEVGLAQLQRSRHFTRCTGVLVPYTLIT